ncbi:MAG: septation protein A [Janthinobacterium lividum]
MKFLFDLFPVILFFGVFKWAEGHLAAAHAMVGQYFSGLVAGGAVEAAQAPILLATVVAIAATVLQIVYLLVRGKKVDTMLWVSLGIITLFGGATIYFHDEQFIKWKPTVLYWLFAIALLFGQLVMKKNFIRTMMEKQFSLPDPIWNRLNMAWAVFFAVMGVVNLLVAFAFNLSTDAWVTFKLFGFTAMMVVFVIGQSVLLSKHMKEPG